MKSKNRFQESVSYRRTGDPNIIERVHVSYIDLRRLKRRIAEIDKELKALPKPKEPPSREEFEKWQATITYDELLERYEFYNMNIGERAYREELERERQALIDRIKELMREAKRGDNA